MITKRTLPKGWRWAKLGDVAEYLNGRAFKPKDWKTSGTPIIRIQNLNSENAAFNYFDGDVEKRYIVENGDLLISWSASLDVFIWQRGTAILNQHIFKATENKEVIRRDYFFYAVKETMEEIRSQVHGATMKHITRPEFLAITIPLPPLDEQKRIAARLDEQMRHIEQARQAAAESLSAAWDLQPAYLNDIFNSQKAKNWSKIKLGKVCEVTARQVDPKIPEYGALPHVNGENIESGTGKLLHLNTAAEDGMTSGKYLFEAGDVLYSKLRPYLRKVFLPDFRGVCSADMYPIKVNHEKLQSQFLVWLLISDGFTKYADEESRRARMPKLNREQLFAFEAPLPSLEQQKQISKMLDQKISECNQLQQSLESQLAEINELPSALLRQAFAGEL